MEAPMGSDELLIQTDGPVLTVVFNRPHQRNAMTWAMYDGLRAACEQADGDERIRVMVLRGAGDRAFVAGTDITQFATFQDGADGVAYEQRITGVAQRLEDVTVPTVAAIQGSCVGGGLILAAVCDLRIATASAQFGAPIARTLGNCLSMHSVALLVDHLGPARTLDLVLRARLISGTEAHAAGFVGELCADDALDVTVADTIEQLLSHAPLTMWATKEAVRRLRRRGLPDGDDLVTRVFGSDDFERAVQAFGRRQPVTWTGT
jgi:enoyl-CoA hydratase/carnithine racemase